MLVGDTPAQSPERIIWAVPVPLTLLVTVHGIREARMRVLAIRGSLEWGQNRRGRQEQQGGSEGPRGFHDYLTVKR